MREQPIRVLLIDGDEADEVLTRDLLSQAKGRQYELVREPTFEGGLAGVGSSAYDVALVASRLGARRGTELVCEACQAGPAPPMILLGRQEDSEEDLEARRAGAVDYLVKDRTGAEVLERAVRYAVARRRAEESRSRLAAIVESSEDAIVGKALEGVITSWNRGAESLYGYSTAEVIGQHFSIIVPPELRGEMTELLERVGRGESIRRLETVRLTQDGGRREVSLTISPIRDSAGKVIGISTIGRDISDKKRQEAALRESESHYRLLFNNNPLPLWVYDLKTLRFLDVNEAAIRHYGYSRAEFLAMTLRDIRPAEDVPGVLASIPTFGAGPAGPATWKHRKKDGTLIDVEIVSDDIAYEGREARLVLAKDITERRRAEEALRVSEERFRDLFENASDIIYTLDLEGNLTSVNRAGENLLGYDSDDLFGKPIRRFVSPAYRDLMVRMMERKMRGEPMTSYEVEMITRDGTPVTLEVNSRLMYGGDRAAGVQGIARDVTARKRAEEALRANEERFRALLENSADGITVMAADGTVTYISPAGERLLGRPQAEVIGHYRADLLQPEEAAQVRADFNDLLAHPGAQQQVSFRVRNADGTWRWIEGVWTNLIDNPSVQGVVLNYRDVTERVSLEDQFRQAQRMEAVGRLAGGIAHDFNNLLTAINGYADLGLMAMRQDDPLRRHLGEIKKAGSRAATLTRHLLAFSRRQVLQPKVLDVNALIADLGGMLPRLIGENIELRTLAGEGLGHIRADPGQLEQVIVNLVVNARDAMPDGGRVVLETRNVFLDDAYCREHLDVTPGPYVMVAVTDTGVGMDEQTRQRIFEPFFTTKEVGKGTGLGLSTVFGIVTQSGGHVWVSSEPGKGTTFKIYLPRVDGEVEKTGGGDGTDEIIGGGETILLVEDEDLVRGVAVAALKGAGYRVLEARNGGEALLLFEKHADKIDLLVTDVVMPGVSGKILAERLAQIRPGLRVLYMSGYTENTVVHHGVLEEGINFLEKPFPPNQLILRVRKVLDGTAGTGILQSDR